MLLFDLNPEYFVQAIADEEGAVQNCLKSLFPKSNISVCLAHKLATLIKHAFACSPKPYKRDAFPEGLEFFRKARLVISHFTSSPKRTRALMRLQKGSKKLALKKANCTRLNGVYESGCF